MALWQNEEGKLKQDRSKLEDQVSFTCDFGYGQTPNGVRNTLLMITFTN